MNISYLSGVSHNERLVNLVEDIKMRNKTEIHELFQELVLFSGSRRGRERERERERGRERERESWLLRFNFNLHPRIQTVMSERV